MVMMFSDFSLFPSEASQFFYSQYLDVHKLPSPFAMGCGRPQPKQGALFCDLEKHLLW